MSYKLQIGHASDDWVYWWQAGFSVILYISLESVLVSGATCWFQSVCFRA